MVKVSRKIFIVMMVFTMCFVNQFSFASDENISLRVKKGEDIVQINRYISGITQSIKQNETSFDKNAIDVKNQGLEKAHLYQNRDDTYVKILIPVTPFSDYKMTSQKDVEAIVADMRESYYVRTTSEDGLKSAIRFGICEDGSIAEHGYIGLKDDFIDQCYDDKLINTTLKDNQLTSVINAKMINFSGMSFKGMYVEDDSSGIIKSYFIPFMNDYYRNASHASNDYLSEFETYKAYPAQDVFLQFKKISQENLKNEGLLGGIGDMGRNHLFRWELLILITFGSILLIIVSKKKYDSHTVQKDNDDK